MVPANPALLSSVIASIYDAAYGRATWDVAIGNLSRLFDCSEACFGGIGPDLQPNDVVVTDTDPAFQRRSIEEHASSPNLLADAMAAADAELLNVIVPHLARATEISRQFHATQLLAATFSHLPFGVIVVDASMRIEASNAAAEAILRQAGSPLVRKSDHLAAADADSAAALQRLVAQACSMRGEVIPGLGGDLLVRRKRGGRDADLALSVALLVDPSHGLPFERPRVDRHAAIFIREMSLDVPAGFMEQVRALFGLSPKEARLAASLASGRTLRQAADDSRIQLSTARSYLENIFHKTGARQQSHLVALLKSAQTIARNRG